MYEPPPNSAPRSGSATPATVRGGGCSAASTTGLVPLAPQTHIGHTQSTQPTFAWFTPETEPYPVEFRIAEYLPEGGLRVIYSTEFESTAKTLPSGITAFSLSDTDFSLTPNQRYRWQAVLVCNPNRPSESLVTEADIFVEESMDSLSPIPSETSAAERAELYAGSGFWYDALAEALRANSDGQSTVKITLLEDLAAIEANEEQEDTVVESYSDRLRQVIDIIR